MINSVLLSYLGEVAAYQSVILVFYWCVLRKQTFFALNRVYLLIGLLTTLVLPLLAVGSFFHSSSPLGDSAHIVYNMVATPIAKWDGSNYLTKTDAFDFSVLISVFETIYLLGVLILFLRFVHNIFNLLNYARNHVKKSKTSTIYSTSLSDAFSFFSSIYLPHRWLNTHESKMIIAHEEAHVHKMHSFDRVFMDVMTILFWFNPFIHLYKKALVEVHEYQADLAVMKFCDKYHYQQLLLAKAGASFTIPTASTFSSLTKKRIIMMNKNKTNRWAQMRYLLILPILLISLSISGYKSTSILVTWENITPHTPDHFQIVVEEAKSDIPSIFPVQYKTAQPLNMTIAEVRVSSTFGQRKDPFTKKMKHHQGIDIATKTGTPVIATADGVVLEVDYKPQGYGRYVELSHSDGYSTKYAQLNEYVVKVGDKVSQGQIIGYVGSTGKSTAPHLHYEVKKDGKSVDPVPFIKDYVIDKC